jgi:hypothetical protein
VLVVLAIAGACLGALGWLAVPVAAWLVARRIQGWRAGGSR